MQGGKSSTFLNTAILIVGLFLFWELAYLVVGDVALRSPKQTISAKCSPPSAASAIY
jgi:hypothetical protein